MPISILETRLIGWQRNVHFRVFGTFSDIVFNIIKDVKKTSNVEICKNPMFTKLSRKYFRPILFWPVLGLNEAEC